jgi:hypothetical protein
MITNSDQSLTLNAGETCVCPHCKQQVSDFEKEIENFTIPGRVGDDSAAETECGNCDKPFITVDNGDGTFTVSKTC